MVNQISSSPTTKPQPQLTAAPHHTAAEDGTVRRPRSRRQGTWVYRTSVVGVKFYILGVQTWWMQWYIKPSTNKMSSNSSKETNVLWFTRGLPGNLARGVITLKEQVEVKIHPSECHTGCHFACWAHKIWILVHKNAVSIRILAGTSNFLLFTQKILPFKTGRDSPCGRPEVVKNLLLSNFIHLKT